MVMEELGLELIIFISWERSCLTGYARLMATANMNSFIYRDGLSTHVPWPQCSELTS